MTTTAHARDIPAAPHHVVIPKQAEMLLNSESNAGVSGGKSPALLSGLLTPLKKAMSRGSELSEKVSSSPASSSPSGMVTWLGHGYATLPISDSFKLVSVQKRRGSSSGSNYSALSGISEASEYPADIFNTAKSGAHPRHKHSLGRSIPRATGFTLEWAGSVPLDSRTFEVKEIGPALIQGGRYHLSLFWSSAHSTEFLNMAAIKSMEVRSARGKTIAKVADDNEISFRKDHGLATFILTKESWLQRAKDPDRRLMWRLRYEPPREPVTSYFSSDSSSQSETSRTSSRTNSGNSSQSSLTRSVSYSANRSHTELKHGHIHHIQAGILSTSPEDLYRSPVQSPIAFKKSHPLYIGARQI